MTQTTNPTSFSHAIAHLPQVDNSELDACITYAQDFALASLSTLLDERAVRVAQAHTDLQHTEEMAWRRLDLPEDASETRVAVHMVGCPFCHAPAGGKCSSKKGGRMNRAHWQRIEASRKASARYGFTL